MRRRFAILGLPLLLAAACSPDQPATRSTSALDGLQSPGSHAVTIAPAPSPLTAEPPGQVIELIPSSGSGPVWVLDWTRRVLGVTALRNTIRASAVSADGRRLLWDDGVVTNAAGAVVGHVGLADPIHGVLQAAWSRDDRRLCGIAPAPGAQMSAKGVVGVADIEVIDSVTGASQRAGPVGQLDAMQATVGVVVCRPDADFAVISVERGSAGEMDVVRLSSGVVLARYPVPSGTFPAISPDGTLIAEPGSNGASSTIRSLANGTIVGHVEGGQVIAFSGDDSRVAAETDGGTAHAGQTRVVDWKSGRVIADGMRQPLIGSAAGVGVATRPGGSEFCLLVYGISSTTPGAVLVAADGTVSAVGPPAVEILPVVPYA